MSDDEPPMTSIDELLLGIATGLAEAQRRLDGVRSVDTRGRPGPTYFLPELELELRVATRLEGEGRDHKLMVRPILPSDTAMDGFRAEGVSTLRGRFVAAPPGSLPPVVSLTTEIHRTRARGRRVEVVVRSGGQPLVGAEVCFDLDLERSRAWSTLEGVELASLATASLAARRVATDAQGCARTELVLDPQAPAGTHIVVTLEVAGERESLVIVA